MYTHNCTKCAKQYSDTDPDAYLCKECLIEKRSIAAKIDAQFAGRVSSYVKSDLQAFEETGKTINVDGRMVTFNKA